jgi:hypothetical protein
MRPDNLFRLKPLRGTAWLRGGPPEVSHSAAASVYGSTSISKRENSVNSAPSQSGKRMLGVGLAVGAGMGSALGVIFGNLPIGVAAGVALGLLAGFALSSRGR